MFYAPEGCIKLTELDVAQADYEARVRLDWHSLVLLDMVCGIDMFKAVFTPEGLHLRLTHILKLPHIGLK